jgi:hypothetical protein
MDGLLYEGISDEPYCHSANREAMQNIGKAKKDAENLMNDLLSKFKVNTDSETTMDFSEIQRVDSMKSK